MMDPVKRAYELSRTAMFLGFGIVVLGFVLALVGKLTSTFGVVAGSFGTVATAAVGGSHWTGARDRKYQRKAEQ